MNNAARHTYANLMNSGAVSRQSERRGALVPALGPKALEAGKRYLDNEKITQLFGVMKVHSVIPSRELFLATQTKLQEFELPQKPMVPSIAVNLLRTYTHFGLGNTPQAQLIVSRMSNIYHLLQTKQIVVCLISIVENAIRNHSSANNNNNNNNNNSSSTNNSNTSFSPSNTAAASNAETQKQQQQPQLRPNVTLDTADVEEFIRGAASSLGMRDLINFISLIGAHANNPTENSNIGRDGLTFSNAASEILAALIPQLRLALDESSGEQVIKMATAILPVVGLLGFRHDVVDFFYLVEQKLVNHMSELEGENLTRLIRRMQRRGISTNLVSASFQQFQTTENESSVADVQEVLRSISAFDNSKVAEQASSASTEIQEVYFDRSLKAIRSMDSPSIRELLHALPAGGTQSFAAKRVMRTCLFRLAELITASSDNETLTFSSSLNNEMNSSKVMSSGNSNNNIGSGGTIGGDPSSLLMSDNNNNNTDEKNTNNNEAVKDISWNSSNAGTDLALTDKEKHQKQLEKEQQEQERENTNNENNNVTNNNTNTSPTTVGDNASSLSASSSAAGRSVDQSFDLFLPSLNVSVSCRELLRIIRALAFHYQSSINDEEAAPLYIHVLTTAIKSAVRFGDTDFTNLPTFEAVQQVTALRYLPPSPEWKELVDKIVLKAIKGRVASAVENANERYLFVCRLGIVPVYSAPLLLEAIHNIPGIKVELVGNLIQPSAAIALLCGLCQLKDATAKEIFIKVAKKLIENPVAALGAGQVESMVELTNAMVQNKVVFPSLVSGLVEAVIPCVQLCPPKDIALLARNFSLLGYKEPGKLRRLVEHVLTEKPPVLANTTNIFATIAQTSPDSPLIAQCCARIRFTGSVAQNQARKREMMMKYFQEKQRKEFMEDSSLLDHDNQSLTEQVSRALSETPKILSFSWKSTKRERNKKKQKVNFLMTTSFSILNPSDHVQLLHAFSLLPAAVLRSNPGYIAALQSAVEQTTTCFSQMKNVFDESNRGDNRDGQTSDGSSTTSKKTELFFANALSSKQLFQLFQYIGTIQGFNTCENTVSDLMKVLGDVLPDLIEHINSKNNNSKNTGVADVESALSASFRITPDQQLQLWSIFSLRVSESAPPKDVITRNLLETISSSTVVATTKNTTGDADSASTTSTSSSTLSPGILSSALWSLVEPVMIQPSDAGRALQICAPIFKEENFVNQLSETQAVISLFSLRMLEISVQQQQQQPGSLSSSSSSLIEENHPLIERIVSVGERWSKQKELAERLHRCGQYEVIRNLALRKKQAKMQSTSASSSSLADQSQQQQQSDESHRVDNNASTDVSSHQQAHQQAEGAVKSSHQVRRRDNTPATPEVLFGFKEMSSIGAEREQQQQQKSQQEEVVEANSNDKKKQQQTTTATLSTPDSTTIIKKKPILLMDAEEVKIHTKKQTVLKQPSKLSLRVAEDYRQEKVDKKKQYAEKYKAKKKEAATAETKKKSTASSTTNSNSKKRATSPEKKSSTKKKSKK